MTSDGVRSPKPALDPKDFVNAEIVFTGSGSGTQVGRDLWILDLAFGSIQQNKCLQGPELQHCFQFFEDAEEVILKILYNTGVLREDCHVAEVRPGRV